MTYVQEYKETSTQKQAKEQKLVETKDMHLVQLDGQHKLPELFSLKAMTSMTLMTTCYSELQSTLQSTTLATTFPMIANSIDAKRFSSMVHGLRLQI